MAKLAEHITLNFDRPSDRVIIEKIQLLAPYMYLKVNPLAKILLHQKVDEKLAEFGISFDAGFTQSACAG